MNHLFHNPLNILEKRLYTERAGTLLIFFAGIVFIGAVVIFLICGSWHFSLILDEGKVGSFGDFIGGVVGTLLAFVASILYYVALKKQQQELFQNQKSLSLQTEALNRQVVEFKQQSEEMSMTRDVYKQQNLMMKEEEKTLHLQQFDSHFFGFFQIYRDLKYKLDQKCNDYFGEILQELNQTTEKGNGKSYQSYCLEAYKSYELIFMNKRNSLASFFRCLYRLIRQVDESLFLSEKDKWRYVKLIRAQISENELLVLYYNCSTDNANKSRNLYYKYNLFKHLQTTQKIEFRNKHSFTESEEKKIALFSEWLFSRIEVFINKVCDENLDGDVNEEYDYLDLKISLNCYNHDDIVHIVCIFKDQSIIHNEMKDIITDLLTDKFYRSKFDNDKEIGNPRDTVDQDTKYRSLEYILSSETISKFQTDLI